MNGRPNVVANDRPAKPDPEAATQSTVQAPSACTAQNAGLELALRLQITPDGRIRGLWNEVVNFTALGRMHVTRASHVEFDARSQRWFVREAMPTSWVRRALQCITRRPCGRILHRATTRSAALAWESLHFSPGGPGWSAIASHPKH